MKYKLLKLKEPYSLIMKLTIYFIILLLGIIIGTSISNIKNHNEPSQIDTSMVDEYTCANGKLHNFKHVTRAINRTKDNTNIEVWAYMCKECGYDKKIVVE